MPRFSCDNFLKSGECRVRKCKHAHAHAQLKPADCKFGDECTSVRVLNNKVGVWKVVNFMNTCRYKHPSEDRLNFLCRQGWTPRVAKSDLVDVPDRLADLKKIAVAPPAGEAAPPSASPDDPARRCKAVVKKTGRGCKNLLKTPHEFCGVHKRYRK